MQEVLQEKQIATFHAHTTRCHHAEGTEREYIESALKGGMKVLGFSDHAPYMFPDGYYSNFRMEPDKLDGYVTTLEKLKEEYKDRITIHIGLEMEYYPDLLKKQMEFLKGYPLEYLILGQHFTKNEYDGAGSGAPTTDESRLKDYVDQVIEGASTGAFLYVAHPDLLNYVGDAAVYDKYMRRLCRETKKLNIPLEINLLGIWNGRPYPNPAFWQIAGQEGCPVVTGSDAHQPDKVYQPDTYARAMDIVRKYGLNYIGEEELL